MVSPLCSTDSALSQAFFPPDLIEPSDPIWRPAWAAEKCGVRRTSKRRQAATLHGLLAASRHNLKPCSQEQSRKKISVRMKNIACRAVSDAQGQKPPRTEGE